MNNKCRWCDLGIVRERTNGTWRHLRKDPRSYLLARGYAPELVQKIGNQWTEVNSTNNVCKAMKY